MTPCPRAGRWFRGCRFEARYDTTPPSVETIRAIGLEDRPIITSIHVDALEALRGLVYRLDVCTRCGATIERTRGND